MATRRLLAEFDPRTVDVGTVIWLKGTKTPDLEAFLDALATRQLSLFFEGPGDRYKVKPMTGASERGRAKLLGSRVTVVEAVSIEHVSGCGCAEAPRMFDSEEEGPFSAWEAAESEKYVVLDRSGKKVFGPSTDYAKAKASAASHGTSVRFLTTASEMFDGASEAPSGGACTPVIRDGIVEKDPACQATSVRLASAKDVWLITREQYARQGHETFEVLVANINDEMVHGPITVARGQTSGVRVEPEQVIIAALGLKNAGGTQVWCSHPHPGEGESPSDMDRELTKRIREAFKSLPSLQFRGHVVCTRKTHKLA